MKKLFVLTPEAQADLRDILLGIAEDSPRAAEKLRVEIYEGFKSLAGLPLLAITTRNYSIAIIGFGTSIPMSSATVGSGHPLRLLLSFMGNEISQHSSPPRGHPVEPRTKGSFLTSVDLPLQTEFEGH